MNTFGDFLYVLRKEKGITQAELAASLGVTNKAVSKWETGEAMPETSLLLPISRIFGVSVDELLEGKRAEDTPDGGGDKDGVRDYGPDDIKRYIFKRGKDDEGKSLCDKIRGAVCSAVVTSGIAAYLFVGVLTGLWHPYWVIIAVCALSCGIIGIIFDLCNTEKRKAKQSRGENPYAGGVCGIVVLCCIIAYLLLGSLFGLWHPYWIIVACGALVCGAIGSVFELISYRKRKK